MLLERLEKLREKLMLSKAEVYTLVGISQPMVSMIKAGTRHPSPKVMRRLEEAEIQAGLRPKREMIASTPLIVRESRAEFPNPGKPPAPSFHTLEIWMQKIDARIERIEKALKLPPEK